MIRFFVYFTKWLNFLYSFQIFDILNEVMEDFDDEEEFLESFWSDAMVLIRSFYPVTHMPKNWLSYKANGRKKEISQCEKLRIFLPLNFTWNQIWRNWKLIKPQFWQFWRVSMQIFSFWRMCAIFRGFEIGRKLGKFPHCEVLNQKWVHCVVIRLTSNQYQLEYQMKHF